jgi:hypothetical protein
VTVVFAKSTEYNFPQRDGHRDGCQSSGESQAAKRLSKRFLSPNSEDRNDRCQTSPQLIGLLPQQPSSDQELVDMIAQICAFVVCSGVHFRRSACVIEFTENLFMNCL